MCVFTLFVCVSVQVCVSCQQKKNTHCDGHGFASFTCHVIFIFVSVFMNVLASFSFPFRKLVSIIFYFLSSSMFFSVALFERF